MTTTTYGLLSTYPPTQCGLATFTAALRTHLGGPGARPKDFGVVRVVDALEPGSPPEVVHELLKGSSSSRGRAVPSSISHSDAHKAELRGVREGALPAGLRQTAANRPGQAQPVPTRDIPTRPWVEIGTFVLIAVTLLAGAWEWTARSWLVL